MHTKIFSKILFLIGLMDFLSSCDQTLKEQISNVVDAGSKDIVVASSEYQLTVPSYLRKVTTLHKDASMQLQNVFKDTYLIIIEEPKDTVKSIYQSLGEYNEDSSIVKNYRDIQIKHIKESLTITDQYPCKSLIINGCAAERLEIDGEVSDLKLPISYIYTFVEGPEKIYTIMAWTLKEKKEKHNDMFTKAIRSFKIVKK